MTFTRITPLLFSILLCLAVLAPGGAAGETLVKLTTPRGVGQSFLLIKPDQPPAAAVILFAGGHGALKLSGAGLIGWGSGNFLVRTRDTFARHGLMVAVMDAPADQQSGMNAIFRMGAAHAGDIGAVAARLRAEANVPVWLVGTSMGTFSAAGGAIGAKGIDGLVLTSTITRAQPTWLIAGSHPHGVASMNLPRITVPTLIMSHRHDGCSITPAADAHKLNVRLTAA
jgi:pimeloyl-ACP methyl ester carboxylesterase